MRHEARTLLLPTALLVLATVAGCDDHTSPFVPTDEEAGPMLAADRESHAPQPLRIMTRNMYLGGNVDLVLGANLSDPVSVVQASATVWAQVQGTRFQERVGALVDEIEAARPHVIGIQEIPLFLILNGAFQLTGAQDHLADLMAEIEARDLPYSVVEVQENITATLPVALDFTTFQVTQWVSFTDRDAVLVRTDVPVLDSDKGSYQAHIPVGPGIDIKRGWIRVTSQWGGVPYHFVNTHLEVQKFPTVQAAQAQELLQVVLAGLDDGITVLMGDLNSDAEGAPGDPSWTATYGLLLEEGFLDSWEMAHPGQPFSGFTCCQSPLLTNEASELDERIDFILLRADRGPAGARRLPGRVKVEIVGDEAGDRTSPFHLWPSDHAGLVATLSTPPGPVFR